MFFCYLDEAGCTGLLPSATSPVQPVFLLTGVAVDQRRLNDLTTEFVAMKRRYFPRLLDAGADYLEWLRAEIKGADLRRNVRSGRRREHRQTIGFLDHVLRLMEKHGIRLIGRVWIKSIGGPFKGRSVYTFSMQACCRYFQHLLDQTDETGLAILDSRDKSSNAAVSHSIFTQKFKAEGDEYGRILEMPVFGHAENHAGIQIADLVSSAILFPIAAYSYCFGRVDNVHVSPEYRVLKDRFAHRIESMQYRYQDISGRWAGGITVADSLGHRSGRLMFRQ